MGHRRVTDRRLPINELTARKDHRVIDLAWDDTPNVGVVDLTEPPVAAGPARRRHPVASSNLMRQGVLGWSVGRSS